MVFAVVYRPYHLPDCCCPFGEVRYASFQLDDGQIARNFARDQGYCVRIWEAECRDGRPFLPPEVYREIDLFIRNIKQGRESSTEI